MATIEIHTQPDDETCGPTSLHAVYRYHQDNISLTEVIKTVKKVKTGGTIAAYLALHALSRNYNVCMYVYNINLFDPTWFNVKTGTSGTKFLINKLKQQLKYFSNQRDIEASLAYIKMLKLGGEIRFVNLNTGLLKKLFCVQLPVITGLSATYLYRSARERTTRKGESVYDDVRGDPTGHFVILCGLDENKRKVIVADPHRSNPISNNNYYKVSQSRLINSIMLGVLTYDSNLLVVSPRE